MIDKYLTGKPWQDLIQVYLIWLLKQNSFPRVCLFSNSHKAHYCRSWSIPPLVHLSRGCIINMWHMSLTCTEELHPRTAACMTIVLTLTPLWLLGCNREI